MSSILRVRLDLFNDSHRLLGGKFKSMFDIVSSSNQRGNGLLATLVVCQPDKSPPYEPENMTILGNSRRNTTKLRRNRPKRWQRDWRFLGRKRRNLSSLRMRLAGSSASHSSCVRLGLRVQVVLLGYVSLIFIIGNRGTDTTSFPPYRRPRASYYRGSLRSDRTKWGGYSAPSLGSND
jgi:hypothetical protein